MAASSSSSLPGGPPPSADAGGADGLVLHVRGGGGAASVHKAMEVDSPEPVAFEMENFEGRCMFLHRPDWSYDSFDTGDAYAYKAHFHGRKRLWEWRLQGRFKRRPGMIYCGVELEEYVPVNLATRTLMRGILPLVQSALQCKSIHHEVGRADDPSLRPVVVAPIWAADNTLVHHNPEEVPDLAATTLPTGLSRKAARQFWETLWGGGGPSWDERPGGPTFTFVVWGPSQLLDLRTWVFRRLPLMWGRTMSLEPFCGQQPVHCVVYELEGGEGTGEHRQGYKVYNFDVRMMPMATWLSKVMGEATYPRPTTPHSDNKSIRPESEESFCSALSQGSSPDPDAEEVMAAEDEQVAPQDEDGFLRSPTAQLPIPLVRAGSRPSWLRAFRCCRRRRRREPQWEMLV